jgi:hypothetical protein
MSRNNSQGECGGEKGTKYKEERRSEDEGEHEIKETEEENK